jgi:hypothetical protein
VTACVVDPVGEHDEHAFLMRRELEMIEAGNDRVVKRRFPTGAIPGEGGLK